MLKQYKGSIVFFYLFTVCALIIAVFTDLKIDIFLNNPTSAFARWFEATGEMPCRLTCTVAGTLIFYLAENKLLKAFGAFADMAGSAYLGYHLSSYFFKEDDYILFGLVFGIGIGFVALYIGKYISIDESLKKPLIVLSIVGIIVMFAQLGSIEILKSLWGRWRFREIITDPNYTNFTAWYHPNGVNGHRSFPSGHTAGAAMSYLMMLLPYVSEKWKKDKLVCFALPFIYTCIVAYTRLVMGAHYLSDVAFGNAIGFTCVIIAMAVIDKRKLIEGK